MVKRCASCGLINAPSSVVCDCGFLFASGDAHEENAAARSQHARGVWLGVLLLVGGLGTLVVYLPASIAMLAAGCVIFGRSVSKWQRVRAWNPPALPEARAIDRQRDET